MHVPFPMFITFPALRNSDNCGTSGRPKLWKWPESTLERGRREGRERNGGVRETSFRGPSKEANLPLDTRLLTTTSSR